MPNLTILTNIVKNEIPKDFVNKVIPVLADTVGKPAEKFVCAIMGDASISFGGNSQEPAAVATLTSIGNLGPERTRLITRAVTSFVQKELGIAPARFFILYHDVSASNVGKNGRTMAEV